MQMVLKARVGVRIGGDLIEGVALRQSQAEALL
jgi:hypothetical protein